MEPAELRAAYERGENVTALMRQEKNLNYNTTEMIELAYDVQAGSYISELSNPLVRQHLSDYTAELARIILDLCEPMSILEPGVGEATTLSFLRNNLSTPIAYACDLSWSRVWWASRWLAEQGQRESTTLCTGDLARLPFADNSIDVVYTSHAIEPNGGREERLLGELYRVARDYLILLEPGYEFAGEEARARMEQHGYCKGLVETAEHLGMKVVRNELFPYAANPLNPTAITVIEKRSTMRPDFTLACPRYKTRLRMLEGAYFSPEALRLYPIIQDIPCLRVEHAIVASCLRDYSG